MSATEPDVSAKEPDIFAKSAQYCHLNRLNPSSTNSMYSPHTNPLNSSWTNVSAIEPDVSVKEPKVSAKIARYPHSIPLEQIQWIPLGRRALPRIHWILLNECTVFPYTNPLNSSWTNPLNSSWTYALNSSWSDPGTSLESRQKSRVFKRVALCRSALPTI